MKAQRTKAKNAARKKLAPPVPFEKALAWLRRGRAIRRHAWHPDSSIFRLGLDVFVKLPNPVNRAPQLWRPYPQDVLATDWEKAR